MPDIVEFKPVRARRPHRSVRPTRRVRAGMVAFKPPSGARHLSFSSTGNAHGRLPLHEQPHIKAALAMATPRPAAVVYVRRGGGPARARPTQRPVSPVVPLKLS